MLDHERIAQSRINKRLAKEIKRAKKTKERVMALEIKTRARHNKAKSVSIAKNKMAHETWLAGVLLQRHLESISNSVYDWHNSNESRKSHNEEYYQSRMEF